MIKMIIFDLGKVLLKENFKSYNDNDIESIISRLSYKSKYDNIFKIKVKNYAKENNLDDYYLIDRLEKFLRDTNTINITEQQIQNLSIHYKLGIASNYISNIRTVIEPLLHYFDVVCISGNMNVEKPDKEFFRILNNKIYEQGIFPNEVLYIDDKNENLEVGRRIGYHTLNYNNSIDTEKSLYDTIINYINEINNIKSDTIENIENNLSKLNYKKNRPKDRLKEKLKAYDKSLYNATIELDNEKDNDNVGEFACVGALPVLNSYGFKPTEPVENLKDNLRKLEFTRPYTEDEILFESEMLDTFRMMNEDIDTKETFPLFIILTYTGTKINKIIKHFTHEPHFHISISFDSSLTKMYSFNEEGFLEEDTKKNYDENTNFSTWVVFLSKDQMDKFKEAINEFVKNKYKYSMEDSTKAKKFTDKYFCSQFVSEMIKIGNDKAVKKDPSLYTPYGLEKIKGTFFLTKGVFKNYSSRKTDERVNVIKDKLNNKKLIEGFSDYIRLNDEKTLLLRYKKINYKEEYNKSHKLLKIYAKLNDTESMKDELCKLFTYYLIIEEIYIQKAKEDERLKEKKEYKNAVIAKTFILGDIKEYLAFIKKKERNFNFSKYYENSKYCKDYLIITKNNVKIIFDLLKYILS